MGMASEFTSVLTALHFTVEGSIKQGPFIISTIDINEIELFRDLAEQAALNVKEVDFVKINDKLTKHICYHKFDVRSIQDFDTNRGVLIFPTSTACSVIKNLAFEV